MVFGIKHHPDVDQGAVVRGIEPLTTALPWTAAMAGDKAAADLAAPPGTSCVQSVPTALDRCNRHMAW